MALDGLLQKGSDALKALTPLSVRRALVRGRLRVRIWTSRSRMLPDFVVIGCQRGGTSSLYKYLGRHPEIAPSLRKETEYFTVNHYLGERWYRAHFPLRWRRRFAELRGSKLLTFEATPDYLFDPRAPFRCRELLPDARIVMLLREPGERALSHYHHNLRLGLEPEDFETALQLEATRLEEEMEDMLTNPRSRALAFRRHSYVARGRYAEQIRRWWSAYPREQVLILESEQFFDDPGSTLSRILEFVGARPWAPPEFRNYSYVDRNTDGHEEVPHHLRQIFDEQFFASNQELRDLIDEDIGWLGRRA